ncbi:hypothetical protein DF3PA_90058 [Candidatus Defluviicoccus seviourii]|uniref:Uncharacterized protein n=2 Tax=root TaxID=1 RepID=A0A564WI51_9PROT|nr:hypothetical protein DF3PB_490014 [uncultured Defluviicoccus sp.]SUS07805.1 hypothetical protein DF3PB_5010002 [uncultured Defluviicoccus sp.]VUX48041.1 hypothetical protein DF3PA_90058 [Candidatus Defluviicoccus seviourii]
MGSGYAARIIDAFARARKSLLTDG